MPETPSGRGLGPKINATKNRLKSSANENNEEGIAAGQPQDKMEDVKNQQQPNQAPFKQAGEDNSDTDDEDNDNEATDPEDKLVTCLVSCLTDCSRQRLRALHMSLRHHGNVDNRVTFKDFQSSLQSNQVKLTQRVLHMISELFEDNQGVDYQRLYLCLTRAHLRTGRDSIKARNKRNDQNNKQEMTSEEIDSDFLRRLQEQLFKEQTYFDVELLRAEIAKWDHNGVGKINKEGVYLILCEKTPLYGALLKNLIDRCEEDKDNKISWPLLLSFLEKAQASAWENHPELSSLPEKYREMASVRIATPDPIDALPASTKSKVVGKLLKKDPSACDPLADARKEGEFKLLSVHRQAAALLKDEKLIAENLHSRSYTSKQTDRNNDADFNKQREEAHRSGEIERKTDTNVCGQREDEKMSSPQQSQKSQLLVQPMADERSETDSADGENGRVTSETVASYIQSFHTLPD